MVVLILKKILFVQFMVKNELPIAPRVQKSFLNGSLESFSKNRIQILTILKNDENLEIMQIY